jgi:hypothetical protein
VTGTTTTNGQTATATAACPVGKLAVGGGGTITNPTSGSLGELGLIASSATSDTVWTVVSVVDGANGVGNYTLTAYVVCVTGP